MQDAQPGDGEQACDSAGAEGAAAIGSHEVMLSATLRVVAQVDGGQVGRDRDRQRADDGRGRVEPARDQVALGVAVRHSSRRDAAEARTEGERRHDRRHGGDDVEVADLPRTRCAGGHGVRCAADDDPQRRQDERDRERRRDRAEGGGVGRPHHGEHEDQPHVVGLPHRRHDVMREVADAPPLPGLWGGDLPDGGAEVGAGQHDVARQSDEDEDQRHGRERHAITSGAGRPR